MMTAIEFTVLGTPIGDDAAPDVRETTSDRDWAFALYSMFARGGDDEQMFYTEVPGDPWSKSRPRFTRRGRTYQPRDDLEAEQRMKWHFKARRPRQFDGNVMLVCRFYRANFQRIDTDNLIKHICDSANGVLWKDDSQVTLVIGETHYDAERPRTIILAGHHASTLLRGSDQQRECANCGEKFTPVRGRRTEQRFCSQACGHKGRIVALDPRTCIQCQQTYRPKTKAQKLCSKECQAEWLRGRNRVGAKPKSRCEECGKQLTHTRGGRCRDCWRAAPGFYGDQPGDTREYVQGVL